MLLITLEMVCGSLEQFYTLVQLMIPSSSSKVACLGKDLDLTIHNFADYPPFDMTVTVEKAIVLPHNH